MSAIASRGTPCPGEVPAVKREPRQVLLNALYLNAGRTQVQLEVALDREPGSLHELLSVLEFDGCVRRERAGGNDPYLWFATGKPLPDAPTSTAQVHRRKSHEGLRYDDSGLLSVWGKWGEHSGR